MKSFALLKEVIETVFYKNIAMGISCVVKAEIADTAGHIYFRVSLSIIEMIVLQFLLKKKLIYHSN